MEEVGRPAPVGRDGGQGRQIKIDADGGENRQHPEQDDQFQTPEASDLGAGRGIHDGHDRGMGPRG